MRVGIADADLIAINKHAFPNLACEKISGYHKEIGDDVHIISDYTDIVDYDKVYVSKVFTSTPVPDWVMDMSTVQIGGTGFYFDKAPALPYEIEHHMPDYDLYEEFPMEIHGANNARRNMYRDYSMGFLTRGCFRKCGFCVNQKYDCVFEASPLEEFFDKSKKRINLLDDNFFGYKGWKPLLQQLIDTGKPYCFRQGLDERLLTDEKCEMLFHSSYADDFKFSFDNIRDEKIIEEKLKMIRRHTKTDRIIFFVLCGFEGTGSEDIENVFKRIRLLFKYGCRPYIMRYMGESGAPWKESQYASVYSTLVRWCNNPTWARNASYKDVLWYDNNRIKTEGRESLSNVASRRLLNEHPEFKEYITMKMSDLREY